MGHRGVQSVSELLPEVTPYAFVSIDRALAYVKREKGAEENAEEWVRTFLGSSTALMESETGRPLAARSYRTQASFTMALAANSTSATCADAADLRERDELAHDDLPAGVIVESISGTTVTLSKKAIGTDAAASVTVGFGPLVIDGRPDDTTPEGYQYFYAPETPLQSLHSVSYRDATGALTEVDITGARIEASSGRVILPAGYLPEGAQNIEIECVAGYLPPRAGRMGVTTDWHYLEQLQFRAVKVAWGDWLNQRGRIGRIQLFTASEFIDDFRLPRDVRDGLAQFRRWP